MLSKQIYQRAFRDSHFYRQWITGPDLPEGSEALPPDKPNLTELNLLVCHAHLVALALPIGVILLPVRHSVRAVVGNIIPFSVLNVVDLAVLHEGMMGLESIPLVDTARSLHRSHALDALV